MLSTSFDMLAPKPEHRIGLLIATVLGGSFGLYYTISHAYAEPYGGTYFYYVSATYPYAGYWLWTPQLYLLVLVWVLVGAVIAAALASIIRLMRA